MKLSYLSFPMMNVAIIAQPMVATTTMTLHCGALIDGVTGASRPNAAELMGMEKQVGTIEPGKLADIVAVVGNPLEDIRLLEDTEFVMKDGVIVKQPSLPVKAGPKP